MKKSSLHAQHEESEEMDLKDTATRLKAQAEAQSMVSVVWMRPAI